MCEIVEQESDGSKRFLAPVGSGVGHGRAVRKHVLAEQIAQPLQLFGDERLYRNEDLGWTAIGLARDRGE